MKSVLLSGVAIIMACSGVFAETGLVKDGTTLRFNVDSGEVFRWDETFPADTTAIFKTGGGVLEVSATNTTYKGPVDIVEGVVRILHKNALGSSTAADRLTDGAVSVSNGAQLVTYCPMVGQTDTAISKRLVLAGSGPDGAGALILGTVEWANQDYYISHLVLAADARILNSDGRRYGITALDLQGHELALATGKDVGHYMFRETKYLTAGTVRYMAPVTWQTGQTFVDDAAGRIIIDSGQTLSLHDGSLKTICPWTLEFGGTGNTYLSVRESANGVWTNSFTGAVEFNSKPHISGGRLSFHGPVSGNGDMYVMTTCMDFRSTLTRTDGILTVGYNGATRPALLRCWDGAIITNKIGIGQSTSPGCMGAVHQYGGVVKNTATSDNKRYIGLNNRSYGYLGVYGGRYTFGKYSFIACGSGSVGMLEVADGSVAAENTPVNVGCGGWGEIYMTGGEFKIYGDTIGSDDRAVGGRMTLTLAGEGDPLLALPWGNSLIVRTATNDYTAIVNLNGGTLKSSGVIKSDVYQNMLPGAKTFLNFNGGTFESFYSSSDIFGKGVTALDRVTVFAGGAKINATKNLSQSADTPLLRPSGRGIASISLPPDMANGDYAGPPEVRISGGGGEGATAHALYDPATRRVTGVEVTSPGWNYTGVPKVTICSKDYSVTNECSVVLTDEEQIDGGLVLTGGAWNVLTLKAVNDYRGDTVLGSDRTQLNVEVPGALPAESTVVFAGGHMNNTSGVPHLKYGVDCKAALEAGGFEYHAGISFPEGSTLDIRNADCFPEDAEKTTLVRFMYNVSGIPRITGIDFGRQSVRLVNKELRIYNKTGMSIIVR
jgi:autotransporter-associated beta strand protein